MKKSPLIRMEMGVCQSTGDAGTIRNHFSAAYQSDKRARVAELGQRRRA